MLSTVSRLMTSVFGSRNQRLLKRYDSFVAAANALEASLPPLADDAFQAKTTELKQRYAANEDLDALAELRREGGQLRVGEALHLRLEAGDLGDDRFEELELAPLAEVQNLLEETH